MPRKGEAGVGLSDWLEGEGAPNLQALTYARRGRDYFLPGDIIPPGIDARNILNGKKVEGQVPERGVPWAINYEYLQRWRAGEL